MHLVCHSGVDVTSMHTMKMQRASTMMSDVKQLLAAGTSLNQPNEDGVTLVSRLFSSIRRFASVGIATLSLFPARP